MTSSIRKNSAGAFYLTVCSGKGGVGKSTLALLLASRLAESGNQTLIIDADFGLGDQATLCNAAAKRGLESVMSGIANLDDAVLQISPRLRLLSTEPGSSISALRFSELGLGQCRLIDTAFDVVVIDTPASLEPAILNLIAASDLAIGVTTPHIPSIADCYSQFKQSLQYNPKLNYALIINRCESEIDGEQAATKFVELVEKFLSRTIRPIGCLETNPIIAKIAESQSLVSASAELNVTVKKLDRLAKVLQEQYINRSRLSSSMWERFSESIPLKTVAGFDDTQSTVHIRTRHEKDNFFDTNRKGVKTL